jgi:hypothetical protein
LWIKTSQGLINTDKFSEIFIPITTLNSEGEYWTVVARPSIVPHDEEVSKKYRDDDSDDAFKTHTHLLWNHDKSTNSSFDTIIEFFNYRDDAQKYLDKLAEKLGAEVIEID